MADSNRRSDRRRAVCAVLATLMYLLTVAATPVLHAQTERMTGTASFESGHTAQCIPLHNEALCPTCGAHRVAAARGAPCPPADAPLLWVAPFGAARVAHSDPANPPPTARAPPLR